MLVEMDIEDHSNEISDGNEEQVIGNRRTGNPCYKVAKNLAELCCSVLWKVEFLSDEIAVRTISYGSGEDGLDRSNSETAYWKVDLGLRRQTLNVSYFCLPLVLSSVFISLTCIGWSWKLPFERSGSLKANAIM